MIYTISVALNSSVEADNESEALETANRMLKEGMYSIMIVDTEQGE